MRLTFGIADADLERGDAVVIAMPYATVHCVVTARTTIFGRDLAVLRSSGREILRLQTSTVPAGSRRILVTARATTTEDASRSGGDACSRNITSHLVEIVGAEGVR